MFEIAFTNRAEKAFLVTLRRTDKGIYAVVEKDAANAYRIPEVYTFDKDMQTVKDVFMNSKEEIESLGDGLYVATAVSDDGIHYQLKLNPKFTVEPVTVYEFIDYAIDIWPVYGNPILRNKYRYILDNIDNAKTLLDCEFIVCYSDTQYGKYYDVYNNSGDEDASGEVIMALHTFTEFAPMHHSVRNITPTVTLRDSMTFTDLVCACASLGSDKKIFGSELMSYMKPNTVLRDLYRKYKKKSSMGIITQIRGIASLSRIYQILQDADLVNSDGDVSSMIKITRYDINFGRSVENEYRVITAYDVQFTEYIHQYLIDVPEFNAENNIRNLLKVMDQIDSIRRNTYDAIEKYLEY